ncbi:hypothetical protein ABTE52_21025, partial [Acinetobacter baumannii]
LFRHDHPQSVKVALLIAEAGEFGFVLYAAAVSAGVMSAEQGSILVALVVLSMAINPVLYRFGEWALGRRAANEPEPEEDFSEVRGEV